MSTSKGNNHKKPNILVIFGDDIGQTNLSAYSHGVMGRTDPYEHADVTSNTYWDWCLDHTFLAVPTQELVGRFLATFREFPPRQKAASFSIDQVVEKLTAAHGS